VGPSARARADGGVVEHNLPRQALAPFRLRLLVHPRARRRPVQVAMDQYSRLNTVATGGLDMEYEEALENFTHCQRNFDLNFVIPEEDIATLMQAVDLAPCKNNIVYYDAFFITDKDIIKKIFNHSWTNSKKTESKRRRNSQIMSNLLVAFIPYLRDSVKHYTSDVEESFGDYHQMMMGIAMTTMGLQANLLGYRTGFCGCVDNAVLADVLTRETGRNFSVLKRCILMGVGKPFLNKPHNWDPYDDVLVGKTEKAQASDYIFRVGS
jgi:nitroreductase